MEIGEFHGSLGVPREVMPQIRNDRINEFLDSLPCDVLEEKTVIRWIKPTQTTYLVEKVLSKEKYFRETKDYKFKKLIVSSDNYLLDGHHNYLGLKNADPWAQVLVGRVPMKMAELLLWAARCDHSYTQTFEELQKQIKK